MPERSCLAGSHQNLEVADLEEVAGEEESDQAAADVVEADVQVVACPCVGTAAVSVEESVEEGVLEVAYDQVAACVLACVVVESLEAGRESLASPEDPCPYPCPCSSSFSSPSFHSMKLLILSGYDFVDHVCHRACHHLAHPVEKACQGVAYQGTYQAVVAFQAGTFQAVAFQVVACQVEVQALEVQAMVEVEHLVAMAKAVADQRLHQVLLS